MAPAAPSAVAAETKKVFAVLNCFDRVGQKFPPEIKGRDSRAGDKIPIRFDHTPRFDTETARRRRRPNRWEYCRGERRVRGKTVASTNTLDDHHRRKARTIAARPY